MPPHSKCRKLRQTDLGAQPCRPQSREQDLRIEAIVPSRSFLFAAVLALKKVLQRLHEPACCAGLGPRWATGSWEQPLKDTLLWEQGTLVLLGLPIAILFHEDSALLIALIHRVLDQRVIGKSSTCTGPWLESWYGFIILSGFLRKVV